MSSAVEALRQALATRGVRYLMPTYVDIHGVSKTKVVPVAHIARMADGSELCTGAALDGVPQDISDEEVAAHPDLDSLAVLPWNPEIAWFASDLYCHDEPFPACSRGIFKRVLAAAADMGLRFDWGIETEFFLLRRDADGRVRPASDADVLDKPCYDLRGLIDNLDYLDELVAAMNGLGWDVYSFDHEDANGQFEIDFMYTDGLRMADRFVFFRLLARELAHRRGLFASFMPKPFADRTGSGAHYNMSLADRETGRNLFASSDDPRGCQLGTPGYHFIAGVLRHAAAITAVIAPTVNSYKRLVRRGNMSGFTWAPIFACYGNNNRTNMLRIPRGGGRVECRAADIACNPYLGGALILAAGLEGIREELDPGAPHTENMYRYDEDDVRAMGIELLPASLGEAIDALAADPLAREVMGDLMFETYVDFKRAEWESYLNHVSDWEVRRYLKFF
ncbi:MAG: type III glutamate--ammonia ligase [Gammaproteobacteria bacterium]